MRKNWLALLLAVLLAAAGLESACAVTIDGSADRGIELKEVSLNEMIDGESPTTGLPLSDRVPGNEDFAGLAVTGRYLPVLVQIDNSDNGSNWRSPWGASYSDVIYESPLRKEGQTRISILYSDLVPDDVGPIRSARLGHVWLREEWDAAFLYHGQQEYALTNVLEELTRLGVTKRGLLFSGTSGGKDWNKYYYNRQNLASPHDKGANAAGILTLVGDDIVPPNHTWLFTDEPAVGDPAVTITVKWGHKDYTSVFRYDAEKDCYFRYVGSKKTEAYHDLDTEEPIAFSNVIIQWTDVDWVVKDAPVTRNTGDGAFFANYSTGFFTAQGNADYFMNGQHMSGAWKRDNMHSRTVFYDENGEEIQLQRGRTMIVMFPNVERQIHTASRKKPTVITKKDSGYVDRSVSYE